MKNDNMTYKQSDDFRYFRIFSYQILCGGPALPTAPYIALYRSLKGPT